MSKANPSQLELGAAAPDFEAQAVGGDFGKNPTTIRLSQFLGTPVVLYFYPKDDTPGCTTQACGLRDHWSEFSKLPVRLFGVSIDGVESHLRFLEKHNLPFPLIADSERKIVELYGVWVEKNMYGKKSWGTERTTFVIGRDGKVAHIFRKVKPDSHAQKLLEVLAQI